MNKRNSVLLFVGILCMTSALWGSTRDDVRMQSPANNVIPSYKQSLKEFGAGALLTSLAVLSGATLCDIHNLPDDLKFQGKFPCNAEHGYTCTANQMQSDKIAISKVVSISGQLQLAGTCGVTGYVGVTLMKKGLTGMYTRFTTANELHYEHERQQPQPAASSSGQ
jgi:hypothetical protein